MGTLFLPGAWSSVLKGQRISSVLTMVGRDSEGTKHLACSNDREMVKLWLHGKVPEGRVLTGTGLLVTSVCPLALTVDESAWICSVPECTWSATCRLVEVCSGLGGFSREAARAGFSVLCGVDANKVWTTLFRELHDGASFEVGDLADPHVVQSLADKGGFHSVMLSGVSCQPHSRLGDGLGSKDARSMSLPKTLSLAWSLQCTMVVMECVPEIQQDTVVQEMLRAFAVATGYRISQQVIRLQNGWCSRRDRWFCVLSAPALGICQLRDLPTSKDFQQVRDVMPCIHRWPEYDQAQIVLNLYELGKYYSYASGGVENLYLKADGKCPTLLHSAGNQLYTCACGCRAALSDERLKARGLFGVLVPLDTSQTHMNQVMTHCRYLHPQEMWALMGGIPGIPTGHNLRLAMAGIGQAVSPLVGLCVMAQVKQHVDKFFAVQPCDPDAVLKAYRMDLVTACQKWWPPPIPPTMPDPEILVDDSEDPIEDFAARISVQVVWPSSQSSSVSVACVVGTTCHQLLEAEQVLTNEFVDLEVRHKGEVLDFGCALTDGMVLEVGPKGVSDVSVREGVGCPVTAQDVVPLAVAPPGGEGNVSAINTLQELAEKRSDSIPKSEREAILGHQGPVWSDDEILAGLYQVARDTDPDQGVQVWDPLLLTGLLTAGNAMTWKELVSPLPVVSTIITAVAVDQHWYPLVWRMDAAGVKLFTCGVSGAHMSVFDFLARIVGLHKGGPEGTWHKTALSFTSVRHCGALVLMYVRHLLWGSDLPQTQEEVDAQVEVLRCSFQNGLADMCLRPRLAALGLSVADRLGQLLVEHGVPSGESVDRARQVIAVLKEEHVDAALCAANAWRELKWLANQQRPPLTLIKPTELQQAIEKRGGHFSGWEQTSQAGQRSG